MFSRKTCVFSFNFFLNKNKKFLHLCHFSEIPSVGLHPLGSIRCQRCREVDLEGHWVQGFNFELIWLVSKELQRSIFFSRFFWKKHFFSINFSIKKHDFPSISIIFFAFRVPPCGRPSKSLRIPTVEPDLERSGPSPRAIICGLTNYSNHHYNMNLLIFIPVNPLLYLVN